MPVTILLSASVVLMLASVCGRMLLIPVGRPAAAARDVAAYGSGATTSSTMVFHAPQDGHFPIQRGLVSPHCVQTYTVFNFAINFS